MMAMMSHFDNEHLNTGDLVQLKGDYEFPAMWLDGMDYVQGRVAGWMDDPMGTKNFCLVELDQVLPHILKVDGSFIRDGRYLLLKLRFQEDSWTDHGVVNVFAFSKRPEELLPKDIQDSWVASHAEYCRTATSTG